MIDDKLVTMQAGLPLAILYTFSYIYGSYRYYRIYIYGIQLIHTYIHTYLHTYIHTYINIIYYIIYNTI